MLIKKIFTSHKKLIRAVTNLGPSIIFCSSNILVSLEEPTKLIINSIKWGLCVSSVHEEKGRGGNPNLFQIPSMLTGTASVLKVICAFQAAYTKFPTTLYASYSCYTIWLILTQHQFLNCSFLYAQI